MGVNWVWYFEDGEKVRPGGVVGKEEEDRVLSGSSSSPQPESSWDETLEILLSVLSQPLSPSRRLRRRGAISARDDCEKRELSHGGDREESPGRHREPQRSKEVFI
jgi:hypothetical protein